MADLWEAITNKLFEQQGGSEKDDSFWALPEVERIGAKAGETIKT